MSLLERPPIDPLAGGFRPDDIDGLLRAYFQSEMPDRWPPFQAPTRTRRPGQKRSSFFQSRFALAASVAVLLGSSMWLSGTFPGTEFPGSEGFPGSLLPDNPQPEKTTASRHSSKAISTREHPSTKSKTAH